MSDCLRFPIPDLGVSSPGSMGLILEIIDRHITLQRPVYVHCWGGIGRTGSVRRPQSAIL